MLPLAGVRVIDLTRALSGSLCTTLLADLGADVVKVEPTPSGDAVRRSGPYHEDVSLYRLSVNRNKRSVAINLRTEEGQQLLQGQPQEIRLAPPLYGQPTAEVLTGIGIDTAQLEEPFDRDIIAMAEAAEERTGQQGPRPSPSGLTKPRSKEQLCQHR